MPDGIPERCRGSTRLPGCRSQVWWDPEGLSSQAAHTQAEERQGAPSEGRGRRFQSTHRHVGGTAGAPGLGLGVNQASADAEVTQLDLTFGVQEDVGGFDVAVDDAVFLLQVQQRLHDLTVTFKNIIKKTNKASAHLWETFIHLRPLSSFQGSALGWGPGFFSLASQHKYPSAPWR